MTIVMQPIITLHNNIDQLSTFAIRLAKSVLGIKMEFVSIFCGFLKRNPQFPHSYPQVSRVSLFSFWVSILQNRLSLIVPFSRF